MIVVQAAVWSANYDIYRVYEKEVNSLKNDSKLKSMKYLVKILFKLDKLLSCFPPVAKSLVCDSQWLLSTVVWAHVFALITK